MSGQQDQRAIAPQPRDLRAVMATVPMGSRGLAPTTMAGLWEIAEMVAASGLAPRGVESPAAIATAMVMGSEIGLTPMQSIQSVAVINGRPSVWGDALLALCLPHLEEFSEHCEGQGDAFAAICRCKRKGSGVVIEQRFSVADAKLAALWGKKGPWTQYPRRMLQMRARGFALRDSCADVLRGIISREEAIDLPPEEYSVHEVSEAITAAAPVAAPAVADEPGLPMPEAKPDNIPTEAVSF